FDADGIADIVAGGMQGAQPIVQVLKFSDGTVLHTFQPFTGTNGVVVGAGDINRDGTPDVVAGAGPGAGSRVVVFDGKTESTLFSFFAFDPEFSGGITLGVGDLDGDGRADIACAAGVLGGPRIQVFKGADGSVFHNFFAYDVLSRQGALITV